jgi:NAD-dependent deacetylase
MTKLDDLWKLINSSRHCVAFTGAGVSTLSGIKDFRGKNGLYKTVDANRMFDIDLFRQDPSVYYEMSHDFIYGIDVKEPSVVHRTLAKLEVFGFLKAIITQNIDLLHSRAGSHRVIELHGSPALHSCLKCGFHASFETVAKEVRVGRLPFCPVCGSVLKPNIVFFGESLPKDALFEAEQEARQADVMLVLGTSLAVYPAATLPIMTVQHGGKIVIVNDMETDLDHFAALRFDDLGETFLALERLLLEGKSNERFDK